MEGRRPRTAGIMGAGPGCGVTHFAVLLANYLTAVERKRTAVLAWDGSRGLEELAVVCTGGKMGANPISILKVDYFPNHGAEGLAWCLQRNYDWILLDFGSAQEGGKAEFLQCGLQFFLGALNEWKLAELMKQKDWMQKGRGHWTFLAAFGSQEARREMKRRYGLWFEPIPYAPDAFSIEEETAAFFKGIWRDQG